MTNYKNGWKLHDLRMDEERLQKNVINFEPKGKRDIACPSLFWKDQKIILEDRTDELWLNP